MSYELGAQEEVIEGIRRSGREQLEKALRELRDGIHSDPVSSVHAARKAIKKERALLRLARPSLKSAHRRAANATLREAARRLSGMRDATVMVHALDGLEERYSGQLPAVTLDVVRSRLEQGRASEQERAAQSEAVAEAIQALDSVERGLEEWTFARAGWRAMKGGLERTYRDGRAAMRRARHDPTLENLHEWRKRVKDLWYDARLLSAVCGPAMCGYASEAEELSELLGDEHDLGVLAQTVAQLEAPVDLPPLLELIDRCRVQLRAEAMLVGRRLYSDPPRVFVRRTRRHWKAGRRLQSISRRRPNTRSNASSSP